MIILDEVAERTKDDKFDGPTLRHPPAAYTRSILLPDYDTSEAQHRTVIIPSSKYKVDSKTWKAALCSLGIYIFLTLTIAVPIIVVKSKEVDNYGTKYPPAQPVWAFDQPNSPPPPKMAIAGMPSAEDSTCNNWQMDSNNPNFVMASFQLPPTGLITIRSNATHESISPDQINGTLSVSMNNYSNESSILFTVELQSSSTDIQNQTSVCFSENGNNRGLSIYIPSNIGDDTLAFNISVVLPQAYSKVDNFVTYLPMFSQTFGDLRQYISFGQINLQGSSSPIYSEFLQASQISVSNLLAAIQGSFNATGSLYLDTIKGPIIADITLSPDCGQTQPSFVRLRTGDSAINANITLNALTTTSIPTATPLFAVQVNNFNGSVQLGVTIENPSPASPLQLQVLNNVGQSTIKMDDNFQGSFYVQTKLSQVFVQDSVDLQTNTSWTLEIDRQTPSKALGWVGWNPRPASNPDACQNYVDILSALAPVNLTFGL